MKKIFKLIVIFISSILFLIIGYLVYVFLSYHRIEDEQVLNISHINAESGTDIYRNNYQNVKVCTEYEIVSFNIGFGAYEPDFGFFMDGGNQSWAWSQERLVKNIDNIRQFLISQNAPFILLQEVDKSATRTYYIDEVELLTDNTGNNYAYALNHDSPFLMYPLTLRPHGRSKSGLLSISDYDLMSSVRHSLPIEGGFRKFVDLDRCYTVSRIKVENGHELLLYNLHLSAYTSDGKIVEEQFKIILSDMQAEFEKGNYCIAGGDFNKDIVGLGSEVFGVSSKEEYSWAQKVDLSLFENVDVRLIAPFDSENPVPSCRNADGPYKPSQYQITVDGFMVTDNVEVVSSKVIDTNFSYSDHNPVSMVFLLK